MSERPNILLIHTDQQRGDCLGADGHPVLETPVMDLVAAMGMRFRRGYSECPTCIPARHTALTGMEPNATGVVGFDTKARIARPEATLPQLLKDSGYQTAHVGRGWHQYPGHAYYGFEIRDGDPFDEYYSKFHELTFPGHMDRSKRGGFPHLGTHGLGYNDTDARPWPYDEEFHETNFSTNKALEFLGKRDAERPFFLSVGYSAPHPPLVPPQAFYDRYINEELDAPNIGDWATPNDKAPDEHRRGWHADPSNGRPNLTPKLLQRTKAGYYGLISHVDSQLRFLIETIVGKHPNTYIFFIADHGEMLGDHYLWRKSLPYEASARVPFLLNGPDIPEQGVSSAPVGLQDILPTCCDIAGIDTPGHVTGRSLLKLAREGEDSEWREFIHGEHSPMGDQHPGMHYMTDGHQKYIWFNDGTEQLFDIDADPQEMKNLSEDSAHTDALEMWRNRLIHKLEGRPEGFSDGKQLIPNRDYQTHNSLATL